MTSSSILRAEPSVPTRFYQVLWHDAFSCDQVTHTTQSAERHEATRSGDVCQNQSLQTRNYSFLWS